MRSLYFLSGIHSEVLTYWKASNIIIFCIIIDVDVVITWIYIEPYSRICTASEAMKSAAVRKEIFRIESDGVDRLALEISAAESMRYWKC